MPVCQASTFLESEEFSTFGPSWSLLKNVNVCLLRTLFTGRKTQMLKFMTSLPRRSGLFISLRLISSKHLRLCPCLIQSLVLVPREQSKIKSNFSISSNKSLERISSKSTSKGVNVAKFSSALEKLSGKSTPEMVNASESQSKKKHLNTSALGNKRPIIKSKLQNRLTDVNTIAQVYTNGGISLK